MHDNKLNTYGAMLLKERTSRSAPEKNLVGFGTTLPGKDVGKSSQMLRYGTDVPAFLLSSAINK